MIGTYGLSGIAALLAGTVWLAAGRWWRSAIALAAGITLVTALALLAQGSVLPASGVMLRIVQPNIGQEDKWKQGFEEESLNRLTRLSRHDGGPLLLLWPEAAVTTPIEDQRLVPLYRTSAALTRRDVRLWISPGDLLLTGGLTIRSSDGLTATSATNSVFALSWYGNVLARYDKAHLVPYGEYLPMRPLLSAIGLSRLAPGDIDFAPGPGARTVALPRIGKVGFQLCYEIIFSGRVVDRRDRPAFLFNPSNDAWFGAWGPPQHLAQARLRALEEGVPILRATPTGISAVIDADGRLLHSLPWRTEGRIDAQLPAARTPTLFARTGNLAPFALALLLALGVIAVRRKEG